MNSDSDSILIYHPKTTKQSWQNSLADAGYVAGVLLQEKDTLSITITKQGSFEGCCVFSVTSVSWELVPPRSSSVQRRTSPIPLPGRLWDATS